MACTFLTTSHCLIEALMAVNTSLSQVPLLIVALNSSEIDPSLFVMIAAYSVFSNVILFCNNPCILAAFIINDLCVSVMAALALCTF